jgi:hypothetical protein
MAQRPYRLTVRASWPSTVPRQLSTWHGWICLAVAATAVVGLAACSGSSATPVAAAPVAVPATISPSGSASPSPLPVNPCSLVTRSQVQSALGGTVAASQLDLTTADVPTCLWAVTGSTIGAGALRVAVTGVKGTAATFTSMQKSFADATTVPGVAKQAFAVDPIGQLILFKNGTTLTLAASGFVLHGADPPRPAVRSALTAVGQSAAAKL